ncbi:MAG: U32 family peptidase [Muribaculum sp.]|nr:U32 family peptidase [Muribaculum sp.]
MQKIELLSPAANSKIAIEAILHGADAVYMGGPSHGARKNAANSIDEIRKTVDFAHIYRAKVYVTVNTIVYDHEIRDVERLITDLYRAGVDALIVQDMGILRMDIPPIQLHASTQCDIRTPEKALFLEKVGFSQLVLARELTLREIEEITSTVSIPVETFIHGALCVSYSGRCHASEACFGRSANRGECAQVCRHKWRLTDASGRKLAPDAHFLSLRDFNASSMLPDLMEAGVSSFKIEGRLKSEDYVKNIVGYYRKLIDDFISLNPRKYQRSSVGSSEISFNPDPFKSFNRGFTKYFLDSRRPHNIWQPSTPKSLGEEIKDISTLHNGDGISFFNTDGEFTGVAVNGVANGRIKSNRPFQLPPKAKIYRTFDNEWQKMISRPTAVRKINMDVTLDNTGVTATDERGVSVRLPLNTVVEKSKKPMDLITPFAKIGNTSFRLKSFTCNIPQDSFIPLSRLTELRRKSIDALQSANRTVYPFATRKPEDMTVTFPYTQLSFADNVSNRLAARFYRDHGVKTIEPALETMKKDHSTLAGRTVMTTRHCILRELGMCRKQTNGRGPHLPLMLEDDKTILYAYFDCDRCEMQIRYPDIRYKR